MSVMIYEPYHVYVHAYFRCLHVDHLICNDLVILLFFLFNLGVSWAYGRAQTNPQKKVQPTDRPVLRICKWALMHGSISVWGVQRHHEVVSSGRVRTRNLGAGRSPSLPLDHDLVILIKIFSL